MAKISQFTGAPSYDMATHAATGFCKPSIILFDTQPGTRSFTIPQGVKRIRAFVVGAGGDGGASAGGSGGGYSEKEYVVAGGDSFSYTVGTPPGGTSSFNAQITATGGGNDGGAAGQGTGGDVSTIGGVSTSAGGASSGQRVSNGFGAIGQNNGAGWGEDAQNTNSGSSKGIDGFGLGILPGEGRPALASNFTGSAHYSDGSDYGCGGIAGSGRGSNAGIGGGGGGPLYGCGGIGGGGGPNGKGGFALVGIEVLEVE